MGKMFLFRETILLGLVGASSAVACPLCESETGERVRAGIFDGDFGYHLAATLLPFPPVPGHRPSDPFRPALGAERIGGPASRGPDQTAPARSPAEEIRHGP